MRKLIAGLIVALAMTTTGSALANPVANDPITAPDLCTSKEFRAVAERSYIPWTQRRSQEDLLTAIKGCAQNQTTLRQMQSIERRLAHWRAHKIRQYHRWTPYVYPDMRLATPKSVAWCESGLNWNNSGGMYGFLIPTWLQYSNLPGPAGANHIEQDRVAHKIAVTVGTGAWECWGGKPKVGALDPMTLPAFSWSHLLGSKP
jgi:hypothetical protein